MKQIRQDAWKQAEDELLVKTVLSYMQEGRTQLEAFKDVSKTLNRTTAACGFRWNASLRQNYVDDIHQAKKSEKNSTQKEVSKQDVKDTEKSSETVDNIDVVIKLLENIKDLYQQDHQQSVDELRQENEQLKQQLNAYEILWSKLDGVVKAGENTIHTKS